MAEQKNILVVVPFSDSQKQALEAAVEGGRYECAFSYQAPEDVDPEDLAQVNVVVGSLPPALIKAAAGLEWLQLSWAGADVFCAPGVLSEQVMLTNASGAYGLACSEQLLAQTFALIREIPLYVRQQEKHEWRQSGDIISVEGSTVLVLGLGDIGGDYARKVKALGAYVIGVRRNAGNAPDYCDEVVGIDGLDGALPRADIIAGALPGGPATFHLLDEARLRACKPDAYIVNVGRGNVIDQEALKRVLADGHLAGVGLDVFESEPLPADDELWDSDRVLITPHVAGQLYLPQTVQCIADICANNLQAWSHGEPLAHVVDRELGY